MTYLRTTPNIENLRKNFEAVWPEMIAREKIEYYTGGLYTAATMASYDNRGCGVPNRLRNGRKVVYQKKN